MDLAQVLWPQFLRPELEAHPKLAGSQSSRSLLRQLHASFTPASPEVIPSAFEAPQGLRTRFRTCRTTGGFPGSLLAHELPQTAWSVIHSPRGVGVAHFLGPSFFFKS